MVRLSYFMGEGSFFSLRLLGRDERGIAQKRIQILRVRGGTQDGVHGCIALGKDAHGIRAVHAGGVEPAQGVERGAVQRAALKLQQRCGG